MKKNGISEFEKLVAEAIDGIGPEFLKKLENVEIVIGEDPSESLFGLYQGVPRTRREQYANVLPDKITIFKNTIEKFFHTPEEIKKAVKDTVWHEIAHHFGMDERQVRQAEKKRKTR